jgi:hypothetical protein
MEISRFAGNREKIETPAAQSAQLRIFIADQ